jgi:hypothetical protein
MEFIEKFKVPFDEQQILTKVNINALSLKGQSS